MLCSLRTQLASFAPDVRGAQVFLDEDAESLIAAVPSLRHSLVSLGPSRVDLLRCASRGGTSASRAVVAIGKGDPEALRDRLRRELGVEGCRTISLCCAPEGCSAGSLFVPCFPWGDKFFTTESPLFPLPAVDLGVDFSTPSAHDFVPADFLNRCREVSSFLRAVSTMVSLEVDTIWCLGNTSKLVGSLLREDIGNGGRGSSGEGRGHVILIDRNLDMWTALQGSVVTDKVAKAGAWDEARKLLRPGGLLEVKQRCIAILSESRDEWTSERWGEAVTDTRLLFTTFSKAMDRPANFLHAARHPGLVTLVKALGEEGVKPSRAEEIAKAIALGGMLQGVRCVLKYLKAAVGDRGSDPLGMECEEAAKGLIMVCSTVAGEKTEPEELNVLLQDYEALFRALLVKALEHGDDLSSLAPVLGRASDSTDSRAAKAARMVVVKARELSGVRRRCGIRTYADLGGRGGQRSLVGMVAEAAARDPAALLSDATRLRVHSDESARPTSNSWISSLGNTLLGETPEALPQKVLIFIVGGITPRESGEVEAAFEGANVPEVFVGGTALLSPSSALEQVISPQESHDR